MELDPVLTETVKKAMTEPPRYNTDLRLQRLNDIVKFSFRGSLAIILCTGATAIAVLDPGFRNNYKDICLLTLGGYIGQLTPKRQKEAED